MQTKLSQVQAAKAAGVSRTTIWRAVKSGKLSAEPADDGSVRIDLSELLRVFPEATVEGNTEHAREHVADGAMNTSEQGDEQGAQAHLETLQAMVDELKADKLHQRDEIGYLQEELTHARQERARLMTTIEEKDRQLAQQMETVRLLTDQRTKKESWWKRLW